MIKVAIVVINYNGNEDTIECIRSLNNFCIGNKDICYDLILVDNASVKPLSSFSLEVCLLPFFYYRSDKNLGFAGGNNYGIEKYREDRNSADYYFLMNNDTILVDDSLNKLVLQSILSDFSITGLVNYYYSSPEKVWQAGGVFRESYLKSNEIAPSPNVTGFTEVDNIPGSSLLVKSDVINSIGLLDDRFFAYYEEIEFCIRAKRKGYKIAFLEGTKILHKVGKSSTSDFKHYLRTRNTLLLYSIHFPQYMHIAILRTLFRTILCCFKIKNPKPYISAYCKGVRDYEQNNFYLGTF